MKKIGILGGGQLGKMLALDAGRLHLPLFALDSSLEFPAVPYVHGFTEGSFNDFDDVYAFGQDKDVVSIEIEHVNTDALFQLEQEGIAVHPNPRSLHTIKDKGLQKEFYKKNGFKSADFFLFEDSDEIRMALFEEKIQLPFVQKLRTEGYDGRGVKVVQSEKDLVDLLEGKCLIESLVDIQKEIGVVVARNTAGEIAAFTPVEMLFHENANLVEFLLCPAQIDTNIAEEAESIARKLIETFDICGLLAIEFFLTKKNQLLINEVAPRPHNSGHHTIDSCYTSQFEQHLRAISGLPLGSTKEKSPAVMLNLLGEKGYTGEAVYQNLDKCLAIEGVNIHLYGKKITKPMRKMGHATILADTVEEAMEKAKQVKELLIIKTAH